MALDELDAGGGADQIGVGEQPDLGYQAVDDREAEDDLGLAVVQPGGSCSAVDEGGPGAASPAGEGLGDPVGAGDHGFGAHAHRGPNSAYDGLRVEQREQPVEVALARGLEERVDD